jgi:hypothetical protein
MKTKIKYISLLLILSIGIWITPQKSSAQVSVSFQVFYDDLSPYGTWVDYANYGYVWIPDVDPGFSPYSTNGYWVYTDEGWTWVSDYAWGWAPFHYGRWYIDAIYGPIWIPDYEWGPGWVTWRRSDDYYGWAPMGPDNGYAAPDNQWVFVENQNFGSTTINNYYVNSSNNITIINNSTAISNTWTDKASGVKYKAGPDKAEVEKHTGKTITSVAIIESTKPGQNLINDQLEIYKPQVQKNSTTGIKPAPAKVASLKDVKTKSEKAIVTPTQKVNQETKQAPIQTQQTVKPDKQTPTETQQTVKPKKQIPTQSKKSNTVKAVKQLKVNKSEKSK